MKYCETCGAKLEENAKFCTACGALIIEENKETICCPSCHAELERQMLFCPVCGHRTDEEPDPVLKKKTEKDKGKEIPLKRIERMLYFSSNPVKSTFSVIRRVDCSGPVCVYPDRIELYDFKSTSAFPAITLELKDVRYLEEYKLRAAAGMKLFMRNGEEKYLVLFDASKKGKAEVQDLIMLIRNLIH